jgi:hypothetical protein
LSYEFRLGAAAISGAPYYRVEPREEESGSRKDAKSECLDSFVVVDASSTRRRRPSKSRRTARVLFTMGEIVTNKIKVPRRCFEVFVFNSRFEVCGIALRHGGQCSETGGYAEGFPASRLGARESRLMEQEKFTSVFCARPQNFAWFLGAAASRAAGLPTATDIIWDLKRQYYCCEENQEITRQDVRNSAVRDRIQSFMEARNFPEQGADEEYSIYFPKMFGEDKERQHRYLREVLSEDRLTLSVGNRVLGALISPGLCRIVFTTNFDSVVEKAVAEVGERSVSAYHLEGSGSAGEALNNEEYPLYCKLHGDFRYDSLKNLAADLHQQNKALSECLVNAGNRFG